MVFRDIFKAHEHEEVYSEKAEEIALTSGAKYGWYSGQGNGGLLGAYGGLSAGGYSGWYAAEPVYQAIETSFPEAGPILRVGTYSLLTYGGAHLGTKIGRYSGRFSGGAVGAGVGAVFDGLEEVAEFLSGERKSE